MLDFNKLCTRGRGLRCRALPRVTHRVRRLIVCCHHCATQNHTLPYVARQHLLRSNEISISYLRLLPIVERGQSVVFVRNGKAAVDFLRKLGVAIDLANWSRSRPLFHVLESVGLPIETTEKLANHERGTTPHHTQHICKVRDRLAANCIDTMAICNCVLLYHTIDAHSPPSLPMGRSFEQGVTPSADESRLHLGYRRARQ